MELKAAGQLNPNQGVYINAIPWLEAQVSSEIENIVTTMHQRLLLDGVGEGEVEPATQELLRYRTGFWQL